MHYISPLLLVARHGGNNYQSKSVRPITTPHSASNIFLAAFDFSSLEDAMLKVLPPLFPNLLRTSSGARTELYDKFKREAEEYDRKFIKKYDEDLNITLIFVSAWFCTCVHHGVYSALLGVQAGLFSAVTSVFIIDAQSNLHPDFQEMNYDLLKIIANVSLGGTPTDSATAFP